MIYICEVFGSIDNMKLFISKNCDICVKKSRYIAKRDDFTKLKCVIDMAIQGSDVGIEVVLSEKNITMCKSGTCLYLKSDRKPRKKRTIKEQYSIQF